MNEKCVVAVVVIEGNVCGHNICERPTDGFYLQKSILGCCRRKTRFVFIDIGDIDCNNLGDFVDNKSTTTS